MKNMKNELYEKLYEGGIFNVELCDKTERLAIKKLIKEKKPIPEDVYLSPSNGYVRYIQPNLTEVEVYQLICLREMKMLKSVRFCVRIMMFAIVIAAGIFSFSLIWNILHK